MRSQADNMFQYPTPNSDDRKKDLIIHIIEKDDREPTYLINFLKQIEFPKSALGLNLIKEVIKESNKLDFIDLFSLINIGEIQNENSRSTLFIDFVEKKGPIFNKKQIADMARTLGIQQESTLQDLQRLPTKNISFEVARSSSDTKEQEQQKMLALINETKSFLDFTMIVEMGIKNEYTQFQGDDNKIGLIKAFLPKPRGKGAITESQFNNFVTNIEISDPQKKDRLDRSFKEFLTKNRIGKILSSKEELKARQQEEPAIENRSTQLHRPLEMTSPQLQRPKLSEASRPSLQEIESQSKIPRLQNFNGPSFMSEGIETPRQLTQNRLIVTSELFFAPPNHNFNPAQPPSLEISQQEIKSHSNRIPFQAQQLIDTKSNKCCTIL